MAGYDVMSAPAASVACADSRQKQEESGECENPEHNINEPTLKQSITSTIKREEQQVNF
jgi:hypothetical protein